MATEEINTVAKFIEHTDRFNLESDLVIYRGQIVRGNLLPGIAREKPSSDTTDLEKEMLRQFELEGATHIGMSANSTIDLLILAQHFGLKTRLLDWSRNPLAALWFACSDPSPGAAFVYALHADNFLSATASEFDPFTTSKTRVFQPRFNNARIIAQDGWFTLHKYSTSSKRFVPLDKNSDIKKHIVELRIEEKYKVLLLDQLNRLGVSARTLFPDLGGLCKNLNFRHRLA